MELPLQISFRHMDRSEYIEEVIRHKAAKLETFAERIMACRVVVEEASRRHRTGNLHDIRINITVPGEEIAVTRLPSEHVQNEDIRVALRDAFDTARRQLQDYVRRQRGAIKTHVARPARQRSLEKSTAGSR
jgi:ribosome-associated translation inhibitor RaiA